MSIQQNVNQSLSIASLLYQHSELAEVARAKKAAGKKTGQRQLQRTVEDIGIGSGADTPTEAAAEYRRVSEEEGISEATRAAAIRTAEAIEVAEAVPTQRNITAVRRQSEEWVAEHEGETPGEYAYYAARNMDIPASGVSRSTIRQFMQENPQYTRREARNALMRVQNERTMAATRERHASTMAAIEARRRQRQGGPK